MLKQSVEQFCQINVNKTLFSSKMDLQVWEVKKDDAALQRAMQASLNRLLANPPKDCQIIFAEKDILTDFPKLAFGIGLDISSIYGYSTAFEHNEGIGLDATRSISESRKIPVYEQNAGRPILRIGIMEVFYPGRGIGSQLIRYLQTRNYEKIEVEPCNPAAENFFVKNGFRDTGLLGVAGYNLFSWDNPKL